MPEPVLPELVMPELVSLAHVAATWMMVGVIWFVQVVHYPLFAGVGRDGFAAYAVAHQRRTTRVVLPPMLAELAAAVLLVRAAPAGEARALAWAGLALLAVVWGATGALLVPAHGRLSGGWDEATGRRLVAVNWLRTAAWSLRGLVALRLLALALEAGPRPPP